MFFESEMSKKVFESKYMLEVDTSPSDAVERVVSVVKKYYPEIEKEVREAILNKWIGVAGGLWRSAMNPNKNVSCINCTTLAQPEDTLESISEAWYWWAKFAAFGQGEGVDLSKLRPNGSIVHNSAVRSTGAVSFMHTFDNVLKVIAQQGRRGASLISLNIEHPDIPDFITVKDQEGVLESANISIQITDEFMKAVEKGKKWEFRFKNKYEDIRKSVQAEDLFRFIAEHAWKSGDPGMQYIDTAHKYSNSDYLGYPIVSTNACSEQVLDPHNTCILSSINLSKYKEFGEKQYIRLIHIGIMMLDAFRRYELEEDRSPSPIQKRKLVELPRIGLGITGLADYFIDHGIRYASKEAIEESRKLFGLLSGEAYKESYLIAKRDGHSFPAYDKNKYMKSLFVKNLLDGGWINESHLDYQAHVCKTTIAPNGTVSEMVEAGGSGIEPIFAKYFVRRERSTTGDWKEWFIYNHTVRRYIEKMGIELTKENVDSVTDSDIWATAHTVDNFEKIKLMSEVQKYIDSAISVTYNLPESSTPQDIENIYMQAWKSNLKAVSVFRDGCKQGVLITDSNYDKIKRSELLDKVHSNRFSPVRPEYVECQIFDISVNREPHIVLVGLIEDRPYEVFVTSNVEGKISTDNYKKGVVHKRKKGKYDLIVENGDTKVIIDDINSKFDSTYNSLSRFISMSLRHGVPLEFIVDQLSKDSNFSGFEKSVSRILKKYIKDNTKVKTSHVCESCGSDSLIYKEGCKTCISCGWSKCD